MAREMKDSGVKWIGEIPNDWSVVQLKRYSKVVSGKEVPVELDADDSRAIPVYGSGGIFKYTDRVQYNGEVVMFGRKGTIGKPLYVNDKFWAVDTMYFLLHNKNHLSPKFNYYQLIAFNWDYYTTQTALPSIVASEVLDSSFPLPPLSEQQAIADFLDAKCAEIDGLLADLEAEVKTLAEYKKSIIAETITHGLNPNATLVPTNLGWIDKIPEHWGLEKAKYAFELRRTKGNIKNLELLSPTQKYGVIPQSQLEGVVLVNEKTNLETFRTIHAGDFCISLRSFQGGFEYSTYEGVVSPAYQVFYPTIDVCDGYYKYMFKSDGFISKINTFSMSLREGKNIAFSDFGNMYIPIPPIEEQVAIAVYLDEKCAEIEQSIVDRQTQIETLKVYKASLIYEYVTGKKQVI